MRTHEQEHDGEVPAPRDTAVTRAAEELPYLAKAAAEGRSDVVGRSGMGTLQRAVGNSAVASMLGVQRAGEEDPEAPAPRSSVHDVLSSGGGRPLEPDTRTDMEARLGADFSAVRVHTDTAAHSSAREVGARAYTVGNDVVFQRDAYDPSSREGRTTLAHELTHVIQQRSGPVEGSEAPGGIRVSDPSDRFEREAAANAERVMAYPTAEASAGTGPTVGAEPAGAAVQRQTEGEDEEPADVQGSFVQRAAGSEAEEEETPPE